MDITDPREVMSVE